MTLGGKRTVVFLMFAGLFVLWRMDGDVGEKAEGVELSERRVLDEGWRRMPEREMTIGEMERYAEGLSDEALRGEFEKSYDDWFEVNRGRTWFYQPRLAVMLAREIGKRNGETGMKEVARWLEERGEELEPGEEDVLEMERRFGDLRVLMAGYAGWVSEDPEGAISRLIESRDKFEEDWPIVNEVQFYLIKLPDSSGIEKVLREGFRELAARDMSKAKELLRVGSEVMAFDVGAVSDFYLFEILEEDRLQAMRAIMDQRSTTSTSSGVTLEVLDPLESSEKLVEDPIVFEGVLALDLWMDGFAEEFIFRSQSENQYSLSELSLLVRARPEAAIDIFMNERVDDDTMDLLAFWLGAEKVENYALLEHLPDNRKLDVVVFWLAAHEMDFGLVIGKKNPGALDVGRLRGVVEKTEMSDEVRSEIGVLLDEWGD